MSTEHTDEWHAGHEAGYEAASEDLVDFVDSMAKDWRAMKITTSEQDLALSWLLRELDRRIRR